MESHDPSNKSHATVNTHHFSSISPRDIHHFFISLSGDHQVVVRQSQSCNNHNNYHPDNWTSLVTAKLTVIIAKNWYLYFVIWFEVWMDMITRCMNINLTTTINHNLSWIKQNKRYKIFNWPKFWRFHIPKDWSCKFAFIEYKQSDNNISTL